MTSRRLVTFCYVVAVVDLPGESEKASVMPHFGAVLARHLQLVARQHDLFSSANRASQGDRL
jgi:hypothetical protein